jgi:hypothetical protein
MDIVTSYILGLGAEFGGTFKLMPCFLCQDGTGSSAGKVKEDGSSNQQFESHDNSKHLLNCMFQPVCCATLCELVQLILKTNT